MSNAQMSNAHRVYVVAGTYRQFEIWRERNAKPGFSYHYLGSAEQVEGLHNMTVLRIGTWNRKIMQALDSKIDVTVETVDGRMKYRSRLWGFEIEAIKFDRETMNYEEVRAFIARAGEPPYLCPTCGGYGEYEGEYGPQGCQPCNSRLIAVADPDTRVIYVDWGEWLTRKAALDNPNKFVVYSDEDFKRYFEAAG